MKNRVKKISQKYTTLLNKIGEMIVSVRGRVLREINKGQVVLYWQIGRVIVEHEQKGKVRAEYGEETLLKLSRDLVNQFGRGFSVDNLQNMRKFYMAYSKMFLKYETLSRKSKQRQAVQKYETLSRILPWSHYCELLKEDNPLARSFYEKEAVENNWSIRELKRQMNAMLFERLALSKDKKKVLQMAKRGQMIERPEDAIKDPYILEFLNLKEEVSYSEGQLEQALIDKLQYFLLELGKGFSFKYKLALPSERQLHNRLMLKGRKGFRSA